MAGLVPAIHVFLYGKQDVDARHKAGHDEFGVADITRIEFSSFGDSAASGSVRGY
jgi:hypothetical protein